MRLINELRWVSSGHFMGTKLWGQCKHSNLSKGEDAANDPRHIGTCRRCVCGQQMIFVQIGITQTRYSTMFTNAFAV